MLESTGFLCPIEIVLCIDYIYSLIVYFVLFGGLFPVVKYKRTQGYVF